ncbi:MAG: DUF4097 family beta strand repeat protein, partial [Bdellovibrionales bacterium]|nr:DUF4097 family beta strand repeat protein [Bdellovibrionales bacterium]
EKVKGAVTINNHSASYQITEIEGPSDFRYHSGTVAYKIIKGQVRLKNVSGVVSLNELDGSFEGDLQKGAINVVATHLQSFVANSDSSPVTLKVSKKSGARVKLRSEKGRLIAPIHLRKVKKGRWSERIGRLKGEEQGQIKIISKYGDIVLK